MGSPRGQTHLLATPQLSNDSVTEFIKGCEAENTGAGQLLINQCQAAAITLTATDN